MPNAKPISAIALCTFCSWRVKMTGDTVLEVATFLRQRVIDHVDEYHPQESNPPVIVERQP